MKTKKEYYEVLFGAKIYNFTEPELFHAIEQLQINGEYEFIRDYVDDIIGFKLITRKGEEK